MSEPTRAAPGPPPRPLSPYAFSYTISPTSPLLPVLPTPVANRHPNDGQLDPCTDPNSGTPPTDWAHFPGGSYSPTTSPSPPPPSPPPPPRKRRRCNRRTDTSPSRTPIRRTPRPARAQPQPPLPCADNTRPAAGIPQLVILRTTSLMLREPPARPELQTSPQQQPARRVTCPRATQAKSAAWGWGWVSMRTPAAPARAPMAMGPETGWRTARPAVLQL
ncbi:hypothetical protein DFP73DRAFT_563069, partial [Morchella snyderi]